MEDEPGGLADLDGAVRRRLLAGADRGQADLLELARQAAPLVAGAGVERAVDRLQADLWGLGPLEPLVADPAVTEVMANGGGDVWVERHGRLEPAGIRLDAATVLQLIERIVAPLGRHVDRASPIVDARLPDGSRVHAVVPPLAVDGPCLTIRRFGTRRITLEEACQPGVAALLRWAVRARANVVVCGGAGSGKTTLLNALAGEVPAGERLVTVEDPAELRLEHPHVVRLEARPGNAEGVGAVTVRDLVRTALRMRPDRIVVGEVRGGEAVDMLAAMGTGHDGSLSTCHANGPSDALARLETLALLGDVGLPLEAIRQQLAALVDLVVQVQRAADGSRSVVAVHEVAGSAGTVPLATGGRLVALPARPPRAPVEAPDPGWLA
jgi:pilus assembly protein CpaF